MTDMPYQLLVNNDAVLEGNIYTLLLIILISLVVMINVVIILWRKIRENETLKYEFITIIAHKFRTPLTHIKWVMEELLLSVQDASAKESIGDIQQSTDKLINLTGTLIELTNTNSETVAAYKFEHFSICELTRNMAAAYKNLFHEKNIFFSVQCPVTDIVANIDRARIEFVLQTLLENSYTYTPPGRKADISVSTEGRKAVISVSDNGIGIDPSDIPHIFSKFYRAKNARLTDTEGFGVGLFMAQSIVKRHKGKIEVYSAGKDQGATFRLILPVVRA